MVFDCLHVAKLRYGSSTFRRRLSRGIQMAIETQDDIIGLKPIGQIVSSVLQRMLDTAEPGMTTLDLDLIGERLLAEYGARSAPQLTYGLPGSTCI